MKFEEYLDSLRNKSVAVIGIGVSNRPLIRLLLERGIRVTACDKKSREALGPLGDELEQHALKLLHAKTGAAVARDIFGVKDAVYKAIRWHTTGKPDMTLLEKVIYLADYIEPNRDFPGVERLRRAVYDDLDKGLLMGLSDTIDEMERMGNPVHHDTLEARDFLLRGEAK
jgi:predicted HD superfamily hydrolase involved in NAD metabolism